MGPNADKGKGGEGYRGFFQIGLVDHAIVQLRFEKGE
jgi:hypothetical protein